jgi:thymidylate kinase
VAGILIEGVTGAGKTQTLRALMHHFQFSPLLGSGRVFDEDETFGEVMTEIQEPGILDHHYLRRLESVLEQLEQHGTGAHASASFVLERFHLSYYALVPDWNLYADFDERLNRLNCMTVLLQIPQQESENRCIDREDRADTPWSDTMITHFGSRPAVLDALVQSTLRRRDAARRSRLPILEIDTGSKSWTAYAIEIVEVWSAMK